MQRLIFSRFYNLFFGVLFTLLASVSAQAERGSFPKSSALEQLQAWLKTTTVRTDLDEHEKDLRLQLLTRLIFQVERKYQGAEFPRFLADTLKDMAETEQIQMNQSFGSIGFFFVNMSVAMTELMERKENPIEFMKSFTEFSGITEPATLEEFSETRQYYDGAGMYKAEPLSLEEAADWMENRERKQMEAFTPSLLENNLEKEIQLEIHAKEPPPQENSAPLESQPFSEPKPSDLMLQNSSNPNADSSLP